jgi:hypothetical protein
MPAPAARKDPVRRLADTLVRQAKADPKKATTLAVLVTVMAVMWYRVMSGGAGGPSSASAYQVPGAFGASTAFGAAPGTPTSADAAARPTRSAAAIAALQEWALRRPIAPLSRNLFVVNYDLFPTDGARPPETAVRVDRGDGFWDQLAKSMAARADQIKEHRARVETLRAEAARLKVQSTLMGASPKALVNGRLVGVGDVVASFRVTRIEARRIVVEREGIKFGLRFN